MTVAQVLHEIRALDPKDRAEVLDSLLKMEEEESLQQAGDEDFDKVSDRVLERHQDLMRKLAQ